MFPMALVCGNTMVMKPSERNPGAIMFIMKLAQEAGIPDGCINVFHGTIERNVSTSFVIHSLNSQVFILTTSLFVSQVAHQAGA